MVGTRDIKVPPRRQLGGILEILCHHTEADLIALQPARA